MSKITTAARQFDKRITATVVELALDVCKAVRDTWEELDMPTALEEAKAITAEYPEASRGPRTTEWKDFVYAAANHNLAGALREAKRSLPNMTRVQMFSLAKKLRTADNAKAALEVIANPPKSKGGRKATIAMGLGIIKNAETRKRNEIAFRKELATICKKHGIKY